MLNVLGTVPEIGSLLAIPGAHVHLYDKPAAPGRKLGHVTLCARDRSTLFGPLSRALAIVERDGSELRRRLAIDEWTLSNSHA